MRVLCLDIEGGFGGSSRSLFEFVRHRPEGFEIEVWCRREGPARARYADIGVNCRITPDMPHFSSLPRLSRNLYSYARFRQARRRNTAFRQDLLRAAAAVDVVHLNHEGLFLLGRWLKSRAAGAVTQHIRTHLPRGSFARWQYRSIACTADRIICITENEQARLAEHVGRAVQSRAIYNIVTPEEEALPHPEVPMDNRLRVAVLSNYAWVRGTDRLVDVARILRERGRADIRFVVAGNMRLHGRLPGHLGELARRRGSLEDYAREAGVAEAFQFLGHVPDPERVLAACHLLAKPTREANPWGRDIIEALGAGKPVMSVGTWDRFVETGVTGVLTPTFDPADWADRLSEFADDRAVAAHLGDVARARIADLCNGPARASDLAAEWRKAIADR
jgi:glycosyltransferase involved in cell wall biosynthesis